MPFQEQVSDEEILEQFDRDDLGRQAFTYAEIAEGIDSVTAEAVRQRLVRMHREEVPKVESVEVGGVRLWHKPGAKVFADGGYGASTWSIAPDLEESLLQFFYDAAKLGGVALVAVVAIMLPTGMMAEYLGNAFGLPMMVRYSIVAAAALAVGLLFRRSGDWPLVRRFNPMFARPSVDDLDDELLEHDRDGEDVEEDVDR